MGSKYRNTFFAAKRPWSVYKDTLLDYYLVPYLEKVKMLRKRLVIVDMFAGRGEFESGEAGSPLIIARRLQKLADQGFKVLLRCYETHEPFFEHLCNVLKPFSFAEALQCDCFDAIDDLASLASDSTILLYVDPCDVSQLNLAQLSVLYEKVKQNTSVEVFLVFMATAFMRQAAWAESRSMQVEESGALLDPLVREAEEDDKEMWLHALYGVEADWYSQAQATRAVLNDVAGGDYWLSILDDATIGWTEKCFRLVDEYRSRLRRWFQIAEALPVHSDLKSAIPKYWILFASRYPPAFDLFNSAACEVVRAQRQNFRQPGTLFAATERQPEAALPMVVDRAVKRIVQTSGSMLWKEIRWKTCGGRSVGQFTGGEVNQSIKRLIKDDWLAGAPGSKVEEDARLSPTSKLKAWVDR